MYMRSRSPANSADSSPPVPARISMKVLRASSGSLGSSMRCNSSSSSGSSASIAAISSPAISAISGSASISCACARPEMLADPEMAEMAGDEIAAIEAELPELEDELQRMLLPKDPDDARNTFIEIRAGTGGDESALFAGDLLRMYIRYAERQGWRTEIVSESGGEVGGYKEV